jgi:hypothetical protein
LAGRHPALGSMTLCDGYIKERTMKEKKKKKKGKIK